MNKGIAFGLGVCTGSAIGSIAAWVIAKKKYKKICDDEIQSVRDAYKNMAHELHEKNLKEKAELLNDPDENKQDHDILVSFHSDGEKQVDYTYVSNYVTNEPDEETVDTVSNKIYEIDDNEFGLDQECTLETLYYFKNDGILTDDKFEEVDSKELLGNTLSNFGERYDEIMYVRNEPRNTEFEILLDDRNFNEIQ